MNGDFDRRLVLNRLLTIHQIIIATAPYDSILISLYLHPLFQVEILRIVFNNFF